MSVLDIIRRKNLIDAPETIATDWVSPSVSLDDRMDEFSISVKYENGTAVNMRVWFQLSNDDENFGDVDDVIAGDPYIQLTDSEGVAIFDVGGSGAQYARIRIEVIAGSIDVVDLKYLAKQLH
jgi:hypothetical protein